MPIPILCYHKVGPIAEEGTRLNIEPARLRQHIRFLRRRYGRFVKAHELSFDWPGEAACLTFDDAYESTLTHGVEVLRSEGAIASIYAVGGQIGGASVWDGQSARPLASADLLRFAHQGGFEIGNHTANHPVLSELDYSRQEEELRVGHMALVEIGIVASTMAYPYGSFNLQTREALRKAGYGVGLALSRRPARETDDRLALPRIVVAHSDTVAVLAYKLMLRWRLPFGKTRRFYI